MCWPNLKVAQKKGLTFHQTRSRAIIIHNTLPAACIVKVVAMSSGEVLYNKIYESPRAPRKVVLKHSWNDGRQDTTSIEERASTAHSGQCRETCSGEIDYWIQGLPHSTVEQEDHRRKVVNKVDSSIQTAPKSRSVESRLEAKTRVQTIQ